MWHKKPNLDVPWKIEYGHFGALFKFGTLPGIEKLVFLQMITYSELGVLMSACHQAWSPELGSYDLLGRTDQIPVSPPLNSTFMPWHVDTHQPQHKYTTTWQMM